MSDAAALERRLTGHFGVPLLVAVASEPIAPDVLGRAETLRLGRLPTAARRDTWLLGRAALRSVLARLGRRRGASRISFPNPTVALTHCDGTAIAVASKHRLAGIGVDYEVSTRPLLGAAHLFLDAREMRWLASRRRAVGARTLLRLWTVKEAAYKATPGNRGTFLKDYSIEQPGRARGYVVFAKGRRRIAYLSMRRGHGSLTVAVNPSRRRGEPD